jgi:hypothetical protein
MEEDKMNEDFKNEDLEKVEREFDSNQDLKETNTLNLNQIHPAHIRYIQLPPLNSLEYFFDLLDKMDNEKRDKILELTYIRVLGGDYSYTSFKNKIQTLSTTVSSSFLVNSIVNYTLSFNISFFNINKLSPEQDQSIYVFNKVRSKRIELNEPLGNPENDYENFKLYLNHMENIMDGTEERDEKCYEWYTYFCDMVVDKLYDESFLDALYKQIG